MSAPAVALVWVDHDGSDWVGIYLNGDRVYEGHPPAAEDAFDAVGVSYTAHTFPSSRLTDHRRMRGLPATLKGVLG